MLLPSVLNASARVQQHIKQAQRQAHARRNAEHEHADPVAVELCLPPVLSDECAHGVIKCPAGHERNEADDEVLLRRRFLHARERLRPDRRCCAGCEGLHTRNDNEIIEPGEEAKILAISGVKLIVEKV